ncbi:MAG: GNAT family N-acetyltransferase [Eubacteriales bacterium]
MQYFIRKAQRCDIELLIELVREIWDQCFRSFLEDESITSYLEGLESGLAREGIVESLSNSYILERDQEIIGYCVWIGSLLQMFMIAPSYQGMGVGAYFLQETMKEAMKGFLGVHLECFEKNQRAVRFYEKMGFGVVGREYDEELKLVRLYYEKNVCKKA